MNTRQWTASVVVPATMPRKTCRLYVGSSPTPRLPRRNDTQPTTKVASRASRLKAVRLARIRVMVGRRELRREGTRSGFVGPLRGGPGEVEAIGLFFAL